MMGTQIRVQDINTRCVCAHTYSFMEYVYKYIDINDWAKIAIICRE